MIREANLSDLEAIGIIGARIHENFLETNKISSRMPLDYVTIYVYEDDGIKGFIEFENHYEIMDIINIGVLKECEGLGIATKLIDHIISNSKASKIMLEVNENNTKAINCYKNNNFVEINRRKKYYGNDDAIIMERNLV